MIDFSNVENLVIPEGEVIKVSCGDEILWEKSGLPLGYRKTAYIECTGTQYINTGFTPNQDSGVLLDFQATTTEANQMFGGRYTSTSRAFTWEIISGMWTFGYKKRINTGIAGDTERHTLQINKNVCVLDGITICETDYSEFTAYKAIHIGRILAASSSIYRGYIKIYSCKLYDNGAIVRDMIPCYNPDGEAGMYDCVNGVFYGNIGDDEFITEQITGD